MTLSTARDVLGVPFSATPEDVRRAFRRRAFEVHPDRNPAPSAADDFRDLRAAYDALRTGPSDGFDADRIGRDIEEAAREADRRRAHSGPAAGETAQVWQQIRVALERPARERFAAGLATPRGRAGLVLGLLLAFASSVGIAAAGEFAVWALAAGALGLVSGVALGAQAVWTADTRPWAVDTHWRGVRDLRWDATIGWDEIAAVEEGNGWVDLVLTEAARTRLQPGLPPGVLVRRPAGAEVAYRLPLRTTAPLAGLVRTQLAAAISA